MTEAMKKKIEQGREYRKMILEVRETEEGPVRHVLQAEPVEHLVGDQDGIARLELSQDSLSGRHDVQERRQYEHQYFHLRPKRAIRPLT